MPFAPAQACATAAFFRPWSTVRIVNMRGKNQKKQAPCFAGRLVQWGTV
jgi:hypothetical protein